MGAAGCRFSHVCYITVATLFIHLLVIVIFYVDL